MYILVTLFIVSKCMATKTINYTKKYILNYGNENHEETLRRRHKSHQENGKYKQR